MRTLRRSISLFALAVLAVGGTACSYISPGHVGMKSTAVGTGKGMQDVATGPAYVFYNPGTTDVIEYPIYVQNVVWTKSTTEGNPVNEEITFTNAQKMQISADVSLAYQLHAEKSVDFYLKFRATDIKEFTNGFMRNIAREEFDAVAGHYSIDQIMGDNAAFLAEVKGKLQADLAPYGIEIVQFGFIGAPRPPQAIIDSINATTHAQQFALQKQNELVQVQADAAKQVAQAEGDAKATLTRAEAQAKANQLLSNSLTPSLVEYKKIEKWNGELPQVSGSGGGVLLNLGTKQ